MGKKEEQYLAALLGEASRGGGEAAWRGRRLAEEDEASREAICCRSGGGGSWIPPERRELLSLSINYSDRCAPLILPLLSLTLPAQLPSLPACGFSALFFPLQGVENRPERRLTRLIDALDASLA